MQLDNKLVQNITDLFAYSCRFKKIYLIADKDDGMYDREKLFARFLEMCDLYTDLKGVNEIDYPNWVSLSCLKSFLPASRELLGISIF